MKYYARLMKATSIRAIAGYHDIAPSSGDDTIPTNFLNNCANGNSVWYSWEHANTYQNWAVLVYESNDNQYYRLPGYPGKTYSAPESTASVYRYASFLVTPQVTPTSAYLHPETNYNALPLSIRVCSNLSRNTRQYKSREIEVSDTSVPDSESVAHAMLVDIIGGDEAKKAICIQRHIIRDEIDDNGILRDTSTVIERTYNFFNTYDGIKIADSYISVSIDKKGINNVDNNWMQIIAAEESRQAIGDTAVNIIFKESAVSIAKIASEHPENFCLYRVNLAYAPTNDGDYVLCHEVVSSCGSCYISIQTGDIIYVL